MKIILASPRGFCAGVDRAIEIVELALRVYGPPVYVRKEIVHNKHVVQSFQERGVVFVETLQEVPASSVAIFSAHGVSPAVRAEAEGRQLNVIDATCPLVTKVHLEVQRFAKESYTIILIGHEGHDEVIGTLGEAPDRVILVQDVEDARTVDVPETERLAFLSQTTLSVDETAEIVDELRKRFPHIEGPSRDDICYATQNRQDAVKKLAGEADVILVLGSANSSNSVRLCEVAEKQGARGYRIDNASEIQPEWLQGASSVGITAGASTPEILVEQTINRLRDLGAESIETLDGIRENVSFALPRDLKEAAVQHGITIGSPS